MDHFIDGNGGIDHDEDIEDTKSKAGAVASVGDCRRNDEAF